MTLIKGIIINEEPHLIEYVQKKKQQTFFSPNKTLRDQQLSIKNAPSSPLVHEAS